MSPAIEPYARALRVARLAKKLMVEASFYACGLPCDRPLPVDDDERTDLAMAVVLCRISTGGDSAEVAHLHQLPAEALRGAVAALRAKVDALEAARARQRGEIETLAEEVRRLEARVVQGAEKAAEAQSDTPATLPDAPVPARKKHARAPASGPRLAPKELEGAVSELRRRIEEWRRRGLLSLGKTDWRGLTFTRSTSRSSGSEQQGKAGEVMNKGMRWLNDWGAVGVCISLLLFLVALIWRVDDTATAGRSALNAKIDSGLHEAAEDRRTLEAKMEHNQREIRNLLLRIALLEQVASSVNPNDTEGD